MREERHDISSVVRCVSTFRKCEGPEDAEGSVVRGLFSEHLNEGSADQGSGSIY